MSTLRNDESVSSCCLLKQWKVNEFRRARASLKYHRLGPYSVQGCTRFGFSAVCTTALRRLLELAPSPVERLAFETNIDFLHFMLTLTSTFHLRVWWQISVNWLESPNHGGWLTKTPEPLEFKPSTFSSCIGKTCTGLRVTCWQPWGSVAYKCILLVSINNFFTKWIRHQHLNIKKPHNKIQASGFVFQTMRTDSLTSHSYRVTVDRAEWSLPPSGWACHSQFAKVSTCLSYNWPALLT